MSSRISLPHGAVLLPLDQRLWMAAIEELEAEGLEETPVPAAFPPELERAENNSQFWNFSSGDDSAQGRWMKITVPGKEIEYVAKPVPMGEEAGLGIGHPKMYDTHGDKAPALTANGRRM